MEQKSINCRFHLWINVIYPLFLFIVLLLPATNRAQSVLHSIEQAQKLIDDKKYNEGYKILLGINDDRVNECGDSCSMLYNYGKGACLYFMDKYEEAIPFLQKSLKYMEKLPHEDCNYLEMMYGIGACYKKLGNYNKAEEYFRKTILKGNYFNLNCAIRNQTYGEMAELYSLMGKPDFADICTSRIESEMRLDSSKNLDAQLDGLWDLYKAHENLGKNDECINDLQKMRHLIEENKGKNNKDYLQYSFLLGSHLRYTCKRPQEAAIVHKEMIEIGKQFKTYRNEVSSAYVEYLRYLSENNKVDSIELILPYAIKYYNNTKDKRGEEDNLYEIVGNGLCDARNYEEGIKYLEKKWKGESANSIKALDYLGAYYFYKANDANKALNYYLNAEKQIEGGLETNLGTKILILERLVLISQRLGNTNEAVRYSTLLEPFMKEQNDDDYRSSFLIDWSVECANNGNMEKAIEIANIVENLLPNLSDMSKIRQYSQLGFVYIKTENYNKSIDNINKGIKLAIQEKGDKCIELTTLYHNLGRAYMLKGDYSNALSALNKSKILQLELEGEVMQRTADYIKECESK